MKPAISVMPAPLIRALPRAALGAAPGVTDAILPSLTTRAPFSITCPSPTMIRALEMTRFCAEAVIAARPATSTYETIATIRMSGLPLHHCSPLDKCALGRITQHHAAQALDDAVVETQMLVDHQGIAQKGAERQAFIHGGR